MDKLILPLESGSNKSSHEIYVSDNANAVINPLKQKKGASKILKKTFIYYGGILSCMLILITFIFVRCEKSVELITSNNIINENNLSSIPLQTIPFTTILQGNTGICVDDYQPRKEMIITDTTEWKNLEREFDSHSPIVFTHFFVETKIDFSTYQIIAVFDKVSFGGTPKTEITDITEYTDKIVVNVSYLNDSSGVLAITRPVLIVQIERSNKKIVFQDNNEIIYKHISIEEE